MGLVGLDNALTRNNLRYRTVQHCTALAGCTTSKLVDETPGTNSRAFPTQRSAPVGVMGTYFYTITYQ
ncbi:hypothetical protein SAMN06269250_3399 [Spirosoma fluviale]|uniref:Uncharacterized protein n=2 Tax=Spirosoma fluviale TaxID=1597977 RepID=A0A286G4H4_9BACT|nr:hypothetical protein SAMN06269250_3399 [Spirosoma fluviale]